MVASAVKDRDVDIVTQPRGWISTSLLFALVPAAIAVALRLAVGELTIDDAFITFRYARDRGGGRRSH
jgi:hypothetical protein